MNYKWLVSLVYAVLVLGNAGCANLLKSSEQMFANIPVVTYGDKVPNDNEYILYFPAGKPIPTTVSIKGDAFAQPAEDVLTVTLKKDIYEYREWISFDGMNWIKGDEAIDFNIEIKVPGYGHPKPGLITVQMNMK